MNRESNNSFHFKLSEDSKDTAYLICRGNVDLKALSTLNLWLDENPAPKTANIILEGSGIEKLDSAGAYLLSEWRDKWHQVGIQTSFQAFSSAHEILLHLVEQKRKPLPHVQEQVHMGFLATVGKRFTEQWVAFSEYLAFIGSLTLEALRVFTHKERIRIASVAAVIYKTGYLALPIIALLSFMIGVVLTYQMGLQLKSYGANIFIVDLLGLSVLREFGPLLTAIMIAGRTGSAFTAELGMMKLNQEIDALNTMGITPATLLILPRVLGLLITLPLLTIWSDIFGIIGGMIMAHNFLNITWFDFLHRFPSAVPLKSLMIGLGKAPVFSLIISSIGCFEGMKVELSAASVGSNTTRSVVSSIFFIIVADAIFSVIFSELKL